MAEQNNRRMLIQQIALITERTIIILGVSIFIMILILLFGVGESLWPQWVIEYRLRILAFLFLVELLLVLSAPLIIEANSNPRTLSGPGKNPQTGI